MHWKTDHSKTAFAFPEQPISIDAKGDAMFQGFTA
jgi:hypothetical protein